jgi:hypothetical protein
MPSLRRLFLCFSPDSFSATTPARGDDATDGVADSGASPKNPQTGSGQIPISARLEMRPFRTVQLKDEARVMKQSYCSVRERIALARTPRWAVLGATLLGLLVPIANAASAQAAPGPWWHLTQRLVPSRIEPGGEGKLVVQALNLGNDCTRSAGPGADGKSCTADDEGIVPSTISASLPAGVEVVEVEGVPQVSFIAAKKEFLGPGDGSFAKYCEVAARQVTCSTRGVFKFGEFESIFNSPPINPYERLELGIRVRAEAGASTGLAGLSASGGGAPEAHVSRPLTIGTGPVPFGLEGFALTPEEEGGAVATRAGSHPYQLTADVAFNRASEEAFDVPALPRNLHFLLPAGQLGNPTVTPRCNSVDFARVEAGGTVNRCPADTVLGAAVVTLAIREGNEEANFTVPVFNLQPAPGEPARFGFEVLRNPVILDTHLRSGNGEDYGVNVDVSNIPQLVSFFSATTTFWGAPDASSHDQSRGWSCIAGERYLAEPGVSEIIGPCRTTSNPAPAAFLTLPTSCQTPFAPGFEGVSWPLASAPGGVEAPPLSDPLSDEAGNPLALTGCNQLPFDPRVGAEPTSNAATSPTGLNFELNFNDEGLLSDEGVAQSQMKKAVVTLPEGFTTNPSVAEGLKACSQAQYESETFESPAGSGCPNESKIGDVTIESPLVEEAVNGSLYVAEQTRNPNHNLLTIYMIAKNPKLGVLIRQALRVTPNPVTGQLTTEVDDVPQLPFSHFELSFRQGQRSPLITPPTCGTYTVGADMSPWARPEESVHRESSFQITTGPEGQGCPNGTPPFHPNLEAGTTNNSAGSYSPFYTRISRKDSEQEITHFSIKLPPGLSGKLAGIAKCSNADIAAAKAREVEGGGQVEEEHPSCPANSEVGHTTVGTGVGNVLAYAPGKLYLAGPYKGSQISIVSITAAKVGPFDLGTVVIREGLKVNPETAQVSVDAAGSDPIPHIVDGIPVHLRDIRIYVDRPNFTINPTSCEKMSTAATVLGSGTDFASEADDQPVTVTSRFQAADCASLAFKPNLSLKLKGKTRRGGLPKLTAVVTYPKGGAYANIAKTVVTLPPSEFLEQGHIGSSCTRVQFNSGAGNGAGCPAKSILGKAKAITPLLEEPVEGNVYLRSNGGERKLPDLVAALHSEDININLVGFISSLHKKGSEVSQIRNTFAAVPDAPVSKFTLELFGGKKGLLVNSTNICKGTHKAISAFTGQNGKLYDTEPAVEAQCGKKGKKGKKSKKSKKSGAKTKKKGAK